VKFADCYEKSKYRLVNRTGVHVAYEGEAEKTRTSKVEIAQSQQHREISVQGIFESFSGANQETFNRSCSEFRLYYAMKKQGHFDRYHGVTPIADMLPFPVSKSYRYGNAELPIKLFRQKRLTIGKKIKVHKSRINSLL